MVSVRSGSEPDPALAGVQREQLHGQHQLRNACRARADGAHPGCRTRSGSAGSRSAASGSNRQRHARVEHGHAGRRRARHRASAAAAARGRRRADDGDLDDAARVSQSGCGKQRDVPAGEWWIRRLVHRGRESPIRGADQRAESSRARPDLDRQPCAGRHARRGHVLRVPRFQRRDVPDQVRTFTPPPVTVAVEKLADGVYYLKGGGHHSVAIDQRDHIVVVEAPLDEARSLAVIAKVKETIPNKPIRSVINTHAHFDHSGGLRTYVAEGATIVTHEMNKPYYEKAWAAPRTLNPDRMAQANKTATFETFTDKHVLTDGRRVIEVHPIVGNGHNDAFAMVYLPAEKILIEVDAWAPAAPNTPPPAAPSPFAVNLYENI